jgi:hypothetical protein
LTPALALSKATPKAVVVVAQGAPPYDACDQWAIGPGFPFGGGAGFAAGAEAAGGELGAAAAGAGAGAGLGSGRMMGASDGASGSSFRAPFLIER